MRILSHLQTGHNRLRTFFKQACWCLGLVLTCNSTVSVAQSAIVLPDAKTGLTLVGSAFTYTVREQESLTAIGARFGIEPGVLAHTNGLAADAHLKPAQKLELDNRHIVPSGVDNGIVINLPQRMLFHMFQGQVQAAFPIAAGRASWQTPLGTFNIDRRVRNKPWIVPKSIQREMQLEERKCLKWFLQAPIILWASIGLD